MRIPERPPSFEAISNEIEPQRFLELMGIIVAKKMTFKGYKHWDEIRRRPLPDGFSLNEWWMLQRIHRNQMAEAVPLLDKTGGEFRFSTPNPIPEILHYIDQNAAGHIGTADIVTNQQTKEQYYVASLIEEAITSSQLEGASTTRQAAKKMIREGRPPHNKSERMIFNNYRAMRRINALKNLPLTPQLIFDLHSIVTDRTWDGEEASGRLRRSDENVEIRDMEGTVFHVPPPAEELAERMATMCAFANGETPDRFIHPVIRSIILHFWLAYDHPFADGNGRTARSLFYWSMLRQGYWLSEYISISRVIRKAPAKYARAFLYVETDTNDLTYFILHQIEVIKHAIEELHQFLERRTAQLHRAERTLQGMQGLNHRQRALIVHALHHPGQFYSIEEHKTSHQISYQTARTDLLSLTDLGLFISWKIGKTWHFQAQDNLEERLKEKLPRD